MKKRTLTVIVTALMVLSMAACGQKDTLNDNSPAQESVIEETGADFSTEGFETDGGELIEENTSEATDSDENISDEQDSLTEDAIDADASNVADNASADTADSDSNVVDAGSDETSVVTADDIDLDAVDWGRVIAYDMEDYPIQMKALVGSAWSILYNEFASDAEYQYALGFEYDSLDDEAKAVFEKLLTMPLDDLAELNIKLLTN